jgi:hypothetical protein
VPAGAIHPSTIFFASVAPRLQFLAVYTLCDIIQLFADLAFEGIGRQSCYAGACVTSWRGDQAGPASLRIEERIGCSRGPSLASFISDYQNVIRPEVLID